jgi:hypothetical protein
LAPIDARTAARALAAPRLKLSLDKSLTTLWRTPMMRRDRLALVVLSVMILSSCLNSENQNKAIADSYENFSCRKPNEKIVYQSNGFNGLLKFCESGWGTTVSVDYGYVVMVAFSDQARGEKTTVYFDSEGNITDSNRFEIDDKGYVLRELDSRQKSELPDDEGSY